MDITDINGTFKLDNGVEMPYLGLGGFEIGEESKTINIIKYALEVGYRHIDTASFYNNEGSVGEAIRQSNVDRKDIFVTSKVWNSEQGYDKTLKSFDDSLNRLGFEYLDLYLVHWAVVGKYIDTWKALEHLYKEGRVKAIGVSNFLIHHIEDILQSGDIVPMVNQVEFHPRLMRKDLMQFCKKHNIQYEAWAPLMQGKILTNDTVTKLAEKYSKTPAQIIIRWDIQNGVVTIPKSSKKERVLSNSQIFDFELSPDDMKLINDLDTNEGLGPDPDNVTW